MHFVHFVKGQFLSYYSKATEYQRQGKGDYSMNMKFTDWLTEEMRKRDNMSPATLAKLAGISEGAISHLFAGRRKPGKDLCLGIATAFKIPPEQVYRIAGILPPEASENAWADQQAYLLSQLTDPALKGVAENFIKSLVEQEASSKKLKPKKAT